MPREKRSHSLIVWLALMAHCTYRLPVLILVCESRLIQLMSSFNQSGHWQEINKLTSFNLKNSWRFFHFRFQETQADVKSTLTEGRYAILETAAKDGVVQGRFSVQNIDTNFKIKSRPYSSGQKAWYVSNLSPSFYVTHKVTWKHFILTDYYQSATPVVFALAIYLRISLDVAEGTIARVITLPGRDLSRGEVRDATRVIGDSTLMKMGKIQINIKRHS